MGRLTLGRGRRSSSQHLAMQVIVRQRRDQFLELVQSKVHRQLKLGHR
jgi:hypothetical protein